MEDLFDLAGKNILFTSAGSYLGHAMSRALAKYGANIVLTSTKTEKAISIAEEYSNKYQGKFAGARFDVFDQVSAKNVAVKAIETLGSIDVLVNCANATVTETLHEISHERWQEGINGSINGVFNIVHEVLPYMLERGKGNIISIGSMYGMVAPDFQVYEGTGALCNPPSYGTGKAAVIQLTKYIACYYGKDGIRANIISPGTFPQVPVQENTAFIENLKRKNPLLRIGKPEDLEGIIVLLASDASSYINGQNIVVDGGWTAW